MKSDSNLPFKKPQNNTTTNDSLAHLDTFFTGKPINPREVYRMDRISTKD